MQDSLGGNAKTLMLVVHAYNIIYVYSIYVITLYYYYMHHVYYLYYYTILCIQHYMHYVYYIIACMYMYRCIHIGLWTSLLRTTTATRPCPPWHMPPGSRRSLTTPLELVYYLFILHVLYVMLQVYNIYYIIYTMHIRMVAKYLLYYVLYVCSKRRARKWPDSKPRSGGYRPEVPATHPLAPALPHHLGRQCWLKEWQRR